jgi:nucleoid-associated protein YgaU
VVAATTSTLPLVVTDGAGVVVAPTPTVPLASTTTVPPAPDLPDPGPVPAPTPEPAPPATWTVRPGEHLWSIARQLVEQAAGRPAGQAEVAPCWRALLDANRDRLPVPGNPDLLCPGDLLVVPPVPSGR